MKTYYRDTSRKHRHDHQVVHLFEQIEAARELSSCCVGSESLLESGRRFNSYILNKQIKKASMR